MTYRSAENQIREIMAKSFLGESVTSDHLNPGNKTSEADRVSAALKVLHDNGCPSAKAKDGKIEVNAVDANRAADVLDHALAKNVIEVRPILVSDNAIPMPEPSSPALSEPVGKIDPIDTPAPATEKVTTEEVQQIDELSTDTLKKVANVARKKGRKDVLNAAIKAGQRKRAQPEYKFAGEENNTVEFDISKQQLDEMSPSTLNSYSKAAARSMRINPIDKKLEKRLEGIKTAKSKIAKTVSKVMFGENTTPVNMLLRVRRPLAEGSTVSDKPKLRLKATICSDCGKHTAKIYKDQDWGEHTVKFHINGKHHEPADYHTNDYHDAMGTANLELKRLSKLNGALKEETNE